MTSLAKGKTVDEPTGHGKKRSPEPLPHIRRHGKYGYKQGCGCPVCQAGHREEANDYNARAREGRTIAPRRSRPGRVEQTVVRELKESSDVSAPWKQTLTDLATLNARMIDTLRSTGQFNLIPPVEAKLLDVLDRIRKAAPPAEASPADSVEAFLNGLGKLAP